MAFFNKKEDVLDIELTQLGKYLMSKGTFKPAFYVFSDDEILYSQAYVNPQGEHKETAKETSKRIQRDTQRLKANYEHDGVETRVMALNGHVTNEQGTQRVFNKIPVEDLYGNDYLLEEHMGKDDRNLVRNFIGHSTVGEQEVPSWDVESMVHGEMTNFIVSSSSPNIGIKRPVLNFEINYDLNVNPMETGDVDFDITAERVNERYNGLEKHISFVDDVRVKVEEGILIFSIVEDNVNYDLDNFEVEFFEIEEERINENANNAATEDLRRLYYTEKYFSDDQNTKLVSDRYIGHYFDVITDGDLAEMYGFDLRGTNREKLKQMFSKAISDHFERIRLAEQDGSLIRFPDGDPLLDVPRTTTRPENENLPVTIGDEEDICDD